ncbi:MAG: LamG-like jellyroll fold domain-containing protein, partial [Bacteroidota bacterium]
VITIQSGDSMMVFTTVNADQVVVAPGGVIHILSGTLQIDDGAGVDLLVNGKLIFAGSFLEGAGTIEVANAASFIWTNGNMRGTGITNFDGGSNANLTTGGGSRIIGDTRTINNNGTVSWSSGTNALLFANSVQFNNYGVFNISTNASFGLSGSPVAPAFNNMSSGILQKIDGSVTDIPGPIAFINSGVVDINNGTLRCSGATLTNFGTLQIASGTTLDLVNATTNLNGNTSITGSGAININGGITNIQFAVQIPSGVTVNLSAGVVQGGNKLRFLNASTMNWSGGELSGNANTEFNAGAILNITGNVGLRGNHYITNGGTINWNTATNIEYDGGSTNSEILNNATFNISNGGSIVNTLGGSNFFNLTNSATGTIIKTNGTTNLDANAFLTNSGAITVSSGVLNVTQFNSPQDGTYSISGGAELTGGTLNFTGSTFTNNGQVSTNEIAFTGTSSQTLGGNGTIQTLRMNNASGVTLTGNPSIYFNLHLNNGKITTGANKIVILGGTSVNFASASSYVDGNMQRDFSAGSVNGVNYAIGDALAYTPVTIDFNNISAPGNLIVNTLGGDHGSISTSGINYLKSVNRIWSFTATGMPFSNCDVTFNWTAGDVDGGANYANFIIAKYDFPNWTLPLVSAPTATSIKAVFLTSFSDFQVGEPAPAVPGAALNFDGSNDYVQMPEFNLGTSDFTIEAWVNPTALPNPAYIVTNRTNELGSVGNWWNFQVQASGIPGFEMGEGGVAPSYVFIPANTAIPTGTWSHIAVVRSGMNIKIYINGMLDLDYNDTYLRNLTSANNTGGLGAWPGGSQGWFNGSMDEVRVWNGVRTQSQIQANMNCELPTPFYPGLTRMYYFNQGIAGGGNPLVTSLLDESGTSNSGTLFNFALSGATSNWVSPGGVTTGNSCSPAPCTVTIP